MTPTVLGDKWRLRSQEIFAFPRISKTSCFRETEDILNSYCTIIRLYNVLIISCCSSVTPLRDF